MNDRKAARCEHQVMAIPVIEPDLLKVGYRSKLTFSSVMQLCTPTHG
ncbi:hypothetical protein [Polaromonas sp.]